MKVPSLGVPNHPELIVEIAGYSRQRLSQEASRIFYEVEKHSIRGGVVIELVQDGERVQNELTLAKVIGPEQNP